MRCFMLKLLIAMIVLGWAGYITSLASAADLLLPVADEIRQEALLPNDSELGHPLPLAAHWNAGLFPTGFTPDYQMQMISKGHYLLPWFQLSSPLESPLPDAYYRSAIQRAAALNLPISFISTQWESVLTYDPGYFNLPPDQNPNVVGPDGSIQQKVDPFGPIAPWSAVGGRWSKNALVQKLQGWYPNPPLVMFISNNEHPKLEWYEVMTAKRYVDLYGLGRDDNFKRQVVGNGWISLYRALEGGMRDGLIPGPWSQNARFVGYMAFGPSGFGRWDGWINYSLYTPGRIEPWPLAWDGVSPPYYLYGSDGITDYQVWSPQVESMNWIFMLADACRLNPGFWFEFSTWDGGSTKRDYFASLRQTYSPERYGGMVKFGMWLIRPRLVREFRMFDDTVAGAEPYFLSIVKAVDSVHNNPLLRKFWRSGQIVTNRAQKHPYQDNVPDEYRTIDRWFLLDTNLDPPRPWSLTTPLPVYSLALVLGQPPEREWLVYAYPPLGPTTKVVVTLPDYGPITVNALPSGAYYHVIEKTKEVEPIISSPSGLRLINGHQ